MSSPADDVGGDAANAAAVVGGVLPLSTSKGKARMDDEAASVPCGICLTDGRWAIPGETDCCSHHFCFVCIMAWARVESRCPFCKARFRTIRRPPVPGRFPSERLVIIAERNQVYHPQGNGSSTVNTDPYVNTSCSVCNCSKDEELLLLCELCDVAAHTYCVGLGATVPEGDWFCKDCLTSKEEHSKCQIDYGRSSDQSKFEISVEVPRDEPVADPSLFYTADEDHSLGSVRRTHEQSSGPFLGDPVPSIYDIVDEDYATNLVCRTNVRSTRPDRKAEDLSLQRVSDGTSGRALLHARARFGVEKARTLRNSRNIGSRIVELRENWSALRAGSVRFATHPLNSGTKNGIGTSAIAEHQRCATAMDSSTKNGVTTSVKEQQQSAAALTEEEINSISSHANKMLSEDTRHVRKAWKMLEMAKSSGGRMKCNKTSSLNCTPPFSMGNRSSSYSPIDTILGQKSLICNEVTQNNNHDRGAKKENTMATKNSEKHLRLPETNHVVVHERMVSSRERMVNQESINGKVASSSNSQHVDNTLESVSDAAGSGKSKSDVLHPLACSLSSGQFTVPSLLQLAPSAGSQSEEASAISVTTSNKIGIAGATVKVRKSSEADCHGCKRKICSRTCDGQESKKSRTSCKIAKSEISSLAIHELKLLKIDKIYGSDKFKEVARATTHTVLAHCGLEHSPSVSLALPKPICKHKCKIEPLRLSAVTNICRDCLVDFVKQVSNLVLSGRQMDPTATSCQS